MMKDLSPTCSIGCMKIQPTTPTPSENWERENFQTANYTQLKTSKLGMPVGRVEWKKKKEALNRVFLSCNRLTLPSFPEITRLRKPCKQARTVTLLTLINF